MQASLRQPKVQLVAPREVQVAQVVADGHHWDAVASLADHPLHERSRLVRQLAVDQALRVALLAELAADRRDVFQRELLEAQRDEGLQHGLRLLAAVAEVVLLDRSAERAEDRRHPVVVSVVRPAHCWLLGLPPFLRRSLDVSFFEDHA